jgi:hypothetical protein
MARGRKLEALNDYRRALKQKYGVGEGQDYKPWLRVQDVKSRGLSSKTQGIKVAREHHTLSQLETEFFYLAEFSDSVIDIREQFPLLPLNLSFKIAQTFEIEHPRVPKTDELSVMTTDFLITRLIDGEICYEAFNIKPASELKNARVLEKIDLERMWWQLLGVKFSQYVGSSLTKIQSQNIAWATDPLRHGFIYENSLKEQALCYLSIGLQTVADFCDLIIANHGLNPTHALNLLQTLIAEKFIYADLSQSIVDTGIFNVLSIAEPMRGAVNEN